MKRYTRGFTLIELLVVIAIIGILASVVLVSLQSARKKGNDTRVIANVQQMRTQLESDYNGSAYPTITAADTVPATGNYVTLAADATANNGGVTAILLRTNATSPFTTYAIYGRLPSDSTKYFCIDSTGNTNTGVTSAPAANDVTCN